MQFIKKWRGVFLLPLLSLASIMFLTQAMSILAAGAFCVVGALIVMLLSAAGPVGSFYTLCAVEALVEPSGTMPNIFRCVMRISVVLSLVGWIAVAECMVRIVCGCIWCIGKAIATAYRWAMKVE